VKGDPWFATVPECISMMTTLGMDLDAAIAAATNRAAAAVGLAGAHGSLAVGRDGDATVLETVTGPYTRKGMLEGEELVEKDRLYAAATILGGKVAWRRAA
jgi:predicted amidohydrolase